LVSGNYKRPPGRCQSGTVWRRSRRRMPVSATAPRRAWLLGRLNLPVRNGLGGDLTGYREGDTMQGMSESVDTVMESMPETCRSSTGNVAGSIAENKAEEKIVSKAETSGETTAEMSVVQAIEREGESSGGVAGYGRGMAPGSKATQFKPRHPGT